METRYARSPESLVGATTQELRSRYLATRLLEPGQLRTVYSFEDRIVVGGAVPLHESLPLVPEGPICSPEFLSRREVGVLHIGGGRGVVRAGEAIYELGPLDMLYLGAGERKVSFESPDAADPARFYLASAMAHRTCPDRLVARDQVVPVVLGSEAGSSRRRLYKVIHPDHVETASLLMGYTELETGSIWNTMPPHLHDRRTEVYFYFGLPERERVVHLLGEPEETRHLFVSNEEAVISPPWSIHAGAGTCAYTFCWAMTGENADYGDLDQVATTELR